MEGDQTPAHFRLGNEALMARLPQGERREPLRIPVPARVLVVGAMTRGGQQCCDRMRRAWTVTATTGSASQPRGAPM